MATIGFSKKCKKARLAVKFGFKTSEKETLF